MFFGFLSFLFPFFFWQIGGLTKARFMTKICFILLLDTVAFVAAGPRIRKYSPYALYRRFRASATPAMILWS